MKNTKPVRKVPMRKCVVTQQRFPKKELIRVVRTPQGEIEIDPNGKMNGHGAYIQASMPVLEKAKKNKALERALESVIPEAIYEKLSEMIADE